MVVCSGLGHVVRGFETFAQEAAHVLDRRSELDVILVNAHGRSGQGERLAPALRRDRPGTRALARLVRRDPYWVEQASYASSLVPVLLAERPDVVYFSDWLVGRALGRWRAASRQRFALLLSNGAAGWPPFDASIDLVQQPTPALLEVALRGGEPRERHSMVPLGLTIEPKLRPPTGAERVGLRERLGLPQSGQIVLSVAALNNWSKRIDYLIREVASLPAPRPHVVLLGQFEDETPAILQLAGELLGPGGFTARTVRPVSVGDYYRAADVLALTSTTEGFGLVLVEAMAQGLLTLAHDYPVTRFVTGEHGMLADIRQDGALARLISCVSGSDLEVPGQVARHDFAYEHFSWDRLAPSYVEMLNRSAATAARRRA